MLLDTSIPDPVFVDQISRVDLTSLRLIADGYKVSHRHHDKAFALPKGRDPIVWFTDYVSLLLYESI